MKAKTLFPLNPARLQHAALGQLVERWLEDVQQAGIDLNQDENVQRLHSELQKQIALYSKSLDQVRGQEETERIIQSNLERRNAIRAFRHAFKACQNLREVAEYDAYKRLELLFDAYKGVEKDSYESATIRLKNWVEHLKITENWADVELLGLTKFVLHLDHCNTAFNEVFSTRSYKILTQTRYDAKALRKNLTQTYRLLTQYAEVMTQLKPSEAYYTKLLDSLNNGRKYFSDAMRNSKSKGKEKVKPNLNED